MKDKKRFAMIVGLIVLGFIILYFLLKKKDNLIIQKDKDTMLIGDYNPVLSWNIGGNSSKNTSCCVGCSEETSPYSTKIVDSANNAVNRLENQLNEILKDVQTGGWYAV